MDIVTGLFLLAIYFIPTIVATARNHHNTTAIFWLNFLLGLTAIGWIVALIWSLTRPLPADGNARCPECRERIRHDARKCKHCGSQINLAGTE